MACMQILMVKKCTVCSVASEHRNGYVTTRIKVVYILQEVENLKDTLQEETNETVPMVKLGILLNSTRSCNPGSTLLLYLWKACAKGE